MMLERTKLINQIIQENGYASYLEIGLHTGENFDAVVCEKKISVDPDNTHAEPTFHMTSSEYFYFVATEHTVFDMVFVDGLHHSEAVHADVISSLKHLDKGGTILIHDCLPQKEERQFKERVTRNWQGDVWKAIVWLAQKGFNMELLDVETGIVKLTEGERVYNIPDGELNWDWYLKNFRNMWE